ncbi:MAG: hypothetical protein WC393_02070 [Candidatus Nanoarchaeia archaeon]|jgi:hypothetical protein
MSLISFINESDVKKKFAETFNLPKIELKVELKAPPITKNYSLVGTAFDYLLRFYIKKHNPYAKTNPWIAELALKCLKDGDLKTKLEKKLEIAKLIYKNYLTNGILTDEVIKTTLILAKIDPIYRAGYIDKNFDEIDEGDIQDLRNLINLVNENSFIAKNICLLNPTFGKASKLVGGADADIIIDDQIIDIKTTKFLKLKEEDLYQIIGYFILFILGGIDGGEGINIKKISIYFSRYGIFFPLLIPLEKNSLIKISNEKFKEFVEWFIKRAFNTFN